MNVKERVSRWIAYFGVLAFGGAVLSGNAMSGVVALLLIGQYAAVAFYDGYKGKESPT